VALREARPEVRLLIDCARTRVDSTTARSIRELAGKGPDWRLLLRMAWQHGTAPLLYRSLDSIAADAVAPAILEEMRGYVHAHAGRAALLTKELVKLLTLFETDGIEAVPLKGPVLAATAYGNLALRMFSDLDVLVRKDQLPAVCKILVGQGYRCPQDRLTPGRLDAFRELFNQHRFVCDRNAVVVEPHWEVIRRSFVVPFDMAELWGRAGTVFLGGTAVRTLAPEDLLLFLCAHGSQHLWSRLAWICDVAEVIRAHPAMDWETAMDRAARIGGERSLLLGLYLANDLLDAALPPEVLHKVRTEPMVKPLATQVLGRLFQAPGAEPDVFRMAAFHIQTKERLRDKALYVLRASTCPSYMEFDAFPLPASLLFLYPLILPVWRLIRHRRRFLKGSAGSRSHRA